MLIGEFQRARLFFKSIAITVTVAFIALYLQPLAVAANMKSAQNAPHRIDAAKPKSNEQELADTVNLVEQTLTKFDNAFAKNANTKTEETELTGLAGKLDYLDKRALKKFNDIGQKLKSKHVPAVILARQQKAIESYKTDMATLRAGLTDIRQAGNTTLRYDAVKRLETFLKKKHRPHHVASFNPNMLPNRALKPIKNNKPKLHKKDFRAAGLFNTPYVNVASTGPFVYNQLAGADDPAYLAETPEVKFSAAIQAKAAALDHDPVKIYYWVRNNIQWQPTWGAIQDADLTLATKQGNDFDIASLLIALLRVSGIPCRYVHGTIDVPTTQFENWAGGFQDAAAAGNFAASGGVPITDLVSGGQVQSYRLEHIWVEAAIDFQPSRGAVNRSADRWAALDASYKQYEYTKGLDAQTISNVDLPAVSQSYIQSGTINSAEGWASGFDPTILQNAQNQIEADAQTYITNNLPNGTVGDVIGGRKIISFNESVLPASLPYHVVTIGARYNKIPSAVEHQVSFAFGTDSSGALINQITYPWVKLNNHKVTLSFRPATDADEQALLALVPDGQIADVSQLPSSIPAYLIQVVPQLAVDGTVVKTGTAIYLGEELPFTYQVAMPGRGAEIYQSLVPAGSYLSVAVVGGGVSTQTLNGLDVRVENMEATLSSGSSTLIRALTREDILGDLFYSGTLDYFTQYMTLSYISAIKTGTKFILLPSMGTYGYEPEVNYYFGIPISITPGRVEMNMDRLFCALGATENDPDEVKNFHYQIGVLSSALENTIPEEMFTTDPQNPVQAISAEKALSIASAQGQRIYGITQANEASVLPDIHLNVNTVAEIRTALAAGKEVITHTDPVSVPGWTGAGYIIIDPLTGDGAYKIGGGTNGGSADIGSGPAEAVHAMSASSGEGGKDNNNLWGDALELASTIVRVLASVAREWLEVCNQIIDIYEYTTKLVKLVETCAGIDPAAAILATYAFSAMFLFGNFIVPKLLPKTITGVLIMIVVAIGIAKLLEVYLKELMKACMVGKTAERRRLIDHRKLVLYV